RLAREVHGAHRADRVATSARGRYAGERASRARETAEFPAGHRGRRAQGAARPAQHLHDPGALLARVDLRPRVRSRGGAGGGRPGSRGGREMTNAPLLTLIAISAIWPFGHRDREKDANGTIKELDGKAVEVDTSATIAGGEAKAIESYRLFLDLASDDPA